MCFVKTEDTSHTSSHTGNYEVQAQQNTTHTSAMVSNTVSTIRPALAWVMSCCSATFLIRADLEKKSGSRPMAVVENSEQCANPPGAAEVAAAAGRAEPVARQAKDLLLVVLVVVRAAVRRREFMVESRIFEFQKRCGSIGSACSNNKQRALPCVLIDACDHGVGKARQRRASQLARVLAGSLPAPVSPGEVH